MAHIIDKWIIIGINGQKQSFKTLKFAKHFIVSQTAAVKKDCLFGGKIIHVIEDKIVSEIAISQFVDSNDIVRYSEEKEYSDPKPYNFFEDLEQAITECCDDDFELSSKSLTEKAEYIYKIVSQMNELKK
jgi:hypothetical protein